MLGCTRQHVQSLIAKGALHSVKLGGKRLIPAAAIDELLGGPGAEPTSPPPAPPDRMPSPLSGDDRLAFALKDVTRVTSLGRDRLYRDIAAGRLEARKCGGRTVILRAELERYLGALPAMPHIVND